MLNIDTLAANSPGSSPLIYYLLQETGANIISYT